MIQSSSPKGVSVVCPDDREIVEKAGVAVVECSWARLEEIPFHKIKSPHERLCSSNLFPIPTDLAKLKKVPYLIAANPVNYGKRSYRPFPPSELTLSSLQTHLSRSDRRRSLHDRLRFPCRNFIRKILLGTFFLGD